MSRRYSFMMVVLPRSIGISGWLPLFLIMTAFLVCGLAGNASAGELTLQDVIRKAVEKNPEMHLEHARAEALNYRVPRVQSFPDPVISVGYQNEGYEKYSNA